MNRTNVVSCSLDGTKSADCTGSAQIMESGKFETISREIIFSGEDFAFHPVTITAGAEKLSENTASETGESTAEPTAEPTVEPTDAESSTSTGGMPAITAVPRWAIVGGGAMVGAALAI